ncbi:glycosyl hydrolase family 28-related protein [Paenibacillus hodogayensis]|uniref:Glycosyl hydrolase family 28-related protein n=1 Tax=Paenibacillus hodogayensis TaxID=279208 RepID=A0ABV5W2X7_9BACL
MINRNQQQDNDQSRLQEEHRVQSTDRRKLLVAIGATAGLAMASSSLWIGDTMAASVTSNVYGPNDTVPCCMEDWYNVRQYGAKGDGSTDDGSALYNLINLTVAGQAAALYFPPGNYRLASSFVFPDHIGLFFSAGASLVLDASVEVTINGMFDAPPRAVFQGSGNVKGKAFGKTLIPQWWGALGNAVADDTSAIQAALDAASANRGSVYLPNGDYKTTSPLVIHWTPSPQTGKVARPAISSIRGEGKNTNIIGTIQTPGRAILELLGSSNSYAVDIAISDITLRMKNGSPEAFCLRVGDCKEFFEARRILCKGANGLALRISSSGSYAQMSTRFVQCSFRSNYNSEWFANDALAEVYAVKPESSGAKWDNVRFESCLFNGLVETRAHIADFVSCQFAVNPSRPVTSREFNANVSVRIGNASFQHCYFEDHDAAVLIKPTLADVDKVLIADCHFSGVSNFQSASCRYGVQIESGTKKLGVVELERCRFGDNSYTIASIRNAGNAKSVHVDKCINLQSPDVPIRIVHTVGNFSISSADAPQSVRKETLRFAASANVPSSGLAMRLDDLQATRFYQLERDCWISRIKVIADGQIVSGSLGIKLQRNGLTEATFIYPDQFTVKSADGTEQGYLLNPLSAGVFLPNDAIGVDIQTDSLSPVPLSIQIMLELAY